MAEVQGAHHPLSGGLYYEDQKREETLRTKALRKERLPKYLGYFAKILESNASGWLVGRLATYADLPLFQLIAGLRYAFARRMKTLEREFPRLTTLHGKVGERPRIAAYLQAPCRLAFSTDGIFRHCPEPDPH